MRTAAFSATENICILEYKIPAFDLQKESSGRYSNVTKYFLCKARFINEITPDTAANGIAHSADFIRLLRSTAAIIRNIAERQFGR